MTKIIFATGNQGKMVEIRDILSGLDYEILSMKEAGIESDPEENGSTFEENAMIKAHSIAGKVPGAIVMADDSGLEIDYLNKEPGIYSARYMGRDVSYDIKNQSFIDKLEGVPEEKRTCRFVCAIAVIMPDGKEFCVRGEIEGRVAHEIKGEYGFGYDPIFYLPEYGCTSAEILPEEKNKISHRALALKKVAEALKTQ